MENIPVPERDPSVGNFRFSEQEKKKMREDGLTEQEIKRREDVANQGIAEKKIEDELRNSGIEIQ